MRIRALVVVAAGSFGLLGLGACATPIGAHEISRGELGEISRVEEGVVLAARFVNIRGAKPILSTKRSRRALGINYVVRLDRTAETISVTQKSDVALGAGARVYVEFGDRVRVIPGATR
jgi:hypothetical protein